MYLQEPPRGDGASSSVNFLIRHHAFMHRPLLGVDCACTTCNWHELRMHHTNSPQSGVGLVNEATKEQHSPTPFLFCDVFSPSFFPLSSFLLYCWFPHAWPSCCTVLFSCSCFNLASGITFFAKIYLQGTVGPWHIRLENVRLKKILASAPRNW